MTDDRSRSMRTRALTTSTGGTMTDQSPDRTSAATGIASTPLGSLPPLGEVPETMLAQVVRQDRFGDPASAFAVDEVPIPVDSVATRCWWRSWPPASTTTTSGLRAGYPVDVIAARQRRGEPEDFHVGGSDASGIVYAIGADVDDIEIGDEVIIHPGHWRADDPWILAGRDPMIAPSARDLGLRHQLRLVRAVLPRAGSSDPAQGAAPHLGGGRRPDSGRHHGLSDAARVAGQHRPRRRHRAGLGRIRRSRHAGLPVGRAGGRPVAVVSDERARRVLR